MLLPSYMHHIPILEAAIAEKEGRELDMNKPKPGFVRHGRLGQRVITLRVIHFGHIQGSIRRPLRNHNQGSNPADDSCYCP